MCPFTLVINAMLVICSCGGFELGSCSAVPVLWGPCYWGFEVLQPAHLARAFFLWGVMGRARPISRDTRGTRRNQMKETLSILHSDHQCEIEGRLGDFGRELDARRFDKVHRLVLRPLGRSVG